MMVYIRKIVYIWKNPENNKIKLIPAMFREGLEVPRGRNMNIYIKRLIIPFQKCQLKYPKQTMINKQYRFLLLTTHFVEDRVFWLLYPQSNVSIDTLFRFYFLNLEKYLFISTCIFVFFQPMDKFIKNVPKNMPP